MLPISVLQNLDVPIKIGTTLKDSGITHLRSFQYLSLYSILIKKRNVLITSPSGSGKTLIGEVALIDSALHGKRGIFAAPYRAICNEKFDRFKRLYEPLGIKIGISTGDFNLDFEELANIDVLVCTYERFDSITRQVGKDGLLNVERVVIDEIHNIGEPKRGPRLEATLARLIYFYPKVQLIGLSATIANPQQLAKWLNAELITNVSRPVPLEYKIIQSYDKNATVTELVEDAISKDKSVIVFTARRKDSESLALKLARIVDVKLSETLKIYLRSLVNDLQDDPEYHSRMSRKLLATIKKGVAFHHAGLNYPHRSLVESLFTKRKIKVIVGTTTLGAGINVPAGVVIIRDPTVPSYIVSVHNGIINERTIMLPLSANKVHQMLGRAGRPGFEDKGTGIILVSSNSEATALYYKYFDFETKKPKYEPIESQMDLQSLMEAILTFIYSNGATTRDDIIKYLKNTYSYLLNPLDDPELSSLLEISPINIKALMKLCSDKDEFLSSLEYKDEDVTILRLSKYLIEGIVDGMPCGFTNRPYCNCAKYHEVKVEGKLCRHLIKLGCHISEKYPDIALIKIPKLVTQTTPLEQLLSQNFVYELDEKFYCTDLGRNTVKLYFRPHTALYLKIALPRVRSLLDFLSMVNRVVALESFTQLKPSYSNALLAIIRGSDLLDVSDKFEIAPGDLENYLSMLKWIISAVTSFSELLGLMDTKNIGEQVLASLASI